jgi:TorA maturation chaperone TorD
MARIVEPENRAVLLSIAERIDVDGEQNLAAAVDALAQAGRAATSSLASSYSALFGHSARGAVSPYETEYGNEALFQQPQELSDLMGFYRAFGLTVRLDRHERADHISCECEFLSFLAMKEAYALEHRNSEMLADTLKAQKLFLRDHLGRFLPTFAQQVSLEDTVGSTRNSPTYLFVACHWKRTGWESLSARRICRCVPPMMTACRWPAAAGLSVRPCPAPMSRREPIPYEHRRNHSL